MIDIQYLTAASGIFSSIALSAMNTILMGHLMRSGDSIIGSLLARQLVCTGIISLYWLWYRVPIRSRYWKLHLIRSMGAPIAGLLWGQAILDGVPLSICGFMSLVISVFSMVIARFMLNEAWPKAGWGLILSVLPVLYDLICSHYRFGICLLLINCVIYGLLDSVNVYIMKEPQSCLMAKIIKHKGVEQPVLINFYDHLASLVIYLVLFASNSSAIQLRVCFVPYYFLMGIALASCMPLVWFSYSLRDISSMQFLRILEPILSGLFGDVGQTPAHILIGTLLFGLSSLLEVINNLGLF